MTSNPPRYEPDGYDDSDSGRYILKYRKPIPCHGLIKWARWYERRGSRRVRRSWFNDNLVSTVFLGVNCNFINGGRLVLFETVIFYGEEGGDKFASCSTWREALRNHRAAKKILKKRMLR